MKRIAVSFVAIAVAAASCADDPDPSDAGAALADAAAGDDAAIAPDAAVAPDASLTPDAAIEPDAGLVEVDTPITDRFRAIAESFESERQNNGAAGAALLILENGEVTFARGFGSKDPLGDDPVHSTTLFRIGSVNKMLTAAALLQFVADGSLDLDDPITTPIPEMSFRLDPTWAPSIKIRHLLTHSSAIVDYIPLDVPDEQKLDGALDSYLTGEFGEIAYLMAPSGVMWNYSNPNYCLAGLALERLSGLQYRQAMKQLLFAPLGMDRTFFLGSEALADGDYANAPSTSELGQPIIIRPDSYESAWGRPAGYAFSTVRDLGRFVQFLLERGDNSVLPDAVRESMSEPQMPMKTGVRDDSYGFGLFIYPGIYLGPNDFRRMKVVSHGGNIPGFTADVFYVPSLRFGYIALGSADLAYFRRTLGLALTTLTTLPPSEPPPSFTPDPADWPRYAGSYLDQFNLGPIEVFAHSSSITVSVPELERANIPYERELVPTGPDNFAWQVQGYNLPVTFIAGEDGTPTYFRTRPAVGTRVRSARLTAPPRRFDRVRFLQNVREEAARVQLYSPPR